jgi:predicted permease
MTYLNTIVVNITLPCLIFLSLIDVTNPELFEELSVLIVVPVIVGILCAIITYFILTLLKLDKKSKWSFLLPVTFGQSAFLGFPLVLGMYGQTHLIRAIFFDISTYILFAGLCIALLIVFGEGLKKSLKEIIVMPTIWSIILGVVFATYNFQLGPILYNALNFLGQATIPISMLILGLSLDFKSLVKNYKIGSIIAFLKVIIFPIISIILLTLLHVSKINLDVSIIESVVPSSQAAVILAINYNLIPKLTSDTVFLSILMSFITIPLILALV